LTWPRSIIAIFYSHNISLPDLLAGLATFAVVFAVRALGVRRGVVYLVLGLVAWAAFLRSGVDPVVVGLVMGLFTQAYPAARSDLELATERFRLFREQPTPELARVASITLSTSISPNERLQQVFHPWTSYVIVPLFALANAGVEISGPFLARAFTSPVTLGILAGYVVGKPVGIAGTSFLVTKISKGRLRPPAGWASVIGAGTIAGIGFTVSLLIAALAFTGPELAEAKVGVLTAGLCAAILTAAVFQLTGLLPKRARARALLGTSEVIVDLAAPVDPDRDHIRGPSSSTATSSARTAAGPSPPSGSCSPASATSATSGVTSRSPTSTSTPSSPPRRPRPRPRRTPSGRCTICCLTIRTRCGRWTW
jgi:hypothetical protein